MESWRKNYMEGRRRARCPRARRIFARVKKTLLRLEGDELRIMVARGRRPPQVWE